MVPAAKLRPEEDEEEEEGGVVEDLSWNCSDYFVAAR